MDKKWPDRHSNDQSQQISLPRISTGGISMDSSCVVEIVIALTTQRPWVIRLENDRSDMCLNV